MSALNSIKDLFILVSVLSLLVVGIGITLRSGLVSSGRGWRSNLMCNLSKMILTLAGYAALFSMVQQLVGYK